MILLLGSRGYIGSAFYEEIVRREIPCRLWTTACWQSVTCDELRSLLRITKPSLVINSAAYIPAESVALCDDNRAETIHSNLVLPLMLAQACQDIGVTLAQISTGCLWSDGLEHSEDDPPQRAFVGHCGFYVGVKHLAEKAVRGSCHKHYIWRVRLPFDEFDHPRNYLSKLARFEEVWDHENTICHRTDFVKACLDLWQMQADWGTYHVANPGSVGALSIVASLLGKGIRRNMPRISEGQPGNAKLSVAKLQSAGVSIRPVDEALKEAINYWKPNVQTSHEMPGVRQ